MFNYGRQFYLIDVISHYYPWSYSVSCQHTYRFKAIPLRYCFIGAQFHNFVAFHSQCLLRARVGAVKSYEIGIVIVFKHLMVVYLPFPMSITLRCSSKLPRCKKKTRFRLTAYLLPLEYRARHSDGFRIIFWNSQNTAFLALMSLSPARPHSERHLFLI